MFLAIRGGLEVEQWSDNRILSILVVWIPLGVTKNCNLGLWYDPCRGVREMDYENPWSRLDKQLWVNNNDCKSLIRSDEMALFLYCKIFLLWNKSFKSKIKTNFFLDCILLLWNNKPLNSQLSRYNTTCLYMIYIWSQSRKLDSST